MKFWNENGETIEFLIVGYKADGSDYNWLVIEITVDLHDCIWSGKSTCMLTWDAIKLADWLDSIWQGETDITSEFQATDGDFRIKLLEKEGDNITLQFTLLYDYARPNNEETILDFHISQKGLMVAREMLLKQLENYPVRSKE